MQRLASRAVLAALIALLPLLGGCVSGYFAALNRGAPPAPPSSLSFLPRQDVALDVFPVQGEGEAPVVVFFYGGRWQDGERADYAFVGEQLAAAGIVTVVADYRLYPEVRFPTFVEDAAAAVAWARENAARYGGRPDALFVAGHSAGAHIAALIGSDPRYLAAHGLRPKDLAGVIGVAGPYDFLPLRADDLIEIFSADPATQAASQPVNHIDGDEPPFLLLHGESDLLVWAENSRRLKARFDAIGAPAELRLYPGVGHVRILGSLRYPALAPTRTDLIEFVHRHAAR
ncbi:alpha/beta hydrolase [Pseudomarimonas salicorniae]|uniref:Alpha/beta hydrolase n=1 Tax=Pseudomarimonas salicorniae TaxID=2933270 RepID=A0ABT0GDX7_9GAMM|nr:alpha/beta hydrolase [Lysobacter sp. CAU 1642]MCK7592747.1 alpha/beta hydrolase [Lysobacter sp. CAU 1642]